MYIYIYIYTYIYIDVYRCIYKGVPSLRVVYRTRQKTSSSISTRETAYTYRYIFLCKYRYIKRTLARAQANLESVELELYFNKQPMGQRPKWTFGLF